MLGKAGPRIWSNQYWEGAGRWDPGRERHTEIPKRGHEEKAFNAWLSTALGRK